MKRWLLLLAVLLTFTIVTAEWVGPLWLALVWVRMARYLGVYRSYKNVWYLHCISIYTCIFYAAIFTQETNSAQPHIQTVVFGVQSLSFQYIIIIDCMTATTTNRRKKSERAFHSLSLASNVSVEHSKSGIRVHTKTTLPHFHRFK